MKRVLLLFLLCVVATCSSSKVSGRRQFLLFSEDRMTQMGVEAYAQMTSSGKANVSNDSRLTAPLFRVGRAISEAAEAQHKPGYDWEFRLIDDAKTVNAWALPGGKIAFYTGIYPILQDEAGMAIVMGHEVMHAILQHGNERMSQSVAAQAILAGAAIGMRNNKYRGEIMGALGVGASVGVILPFSRKHESEADQYGLYLAAAAGYNPEAGIKVWERMAAMSEGKRPPELLSTHPDPLNRIENMRKWMPKAKAIYNQSRKANAQPLPSVR